MTKADKQAEDIAALRAEVEALKASLSGKEDKPPPKSTFKPMSDAEHQDWVHQMRERRMSMATPPSVVRDFAVLDDKMVKEIALRDSRGPTSPSGAIPRSQQATGSSGPPPSLTPGWCEPRPLTNPPGTQWVDAIAIADDVRQRKESSKP
jgi:hypothetical protein